MREYYCSYDLELCHSSILEKQIFPQFQKVQRGEFLILLPSIRASEQWQKKLLLYENFPRTPEHSAFKKDTVTHIDKFFLTLYESESLEKGSSDIRMSPVHSHFLIRQLLKSLSSELYLGYLWTKTSFVQDLAKILKELKSEVFTDFESYPFPKKEIWEDYCHSQGVYGRLLEKCEDLYRIWVEYETQKKKLCWIDSSDLKQYLIQHSDSVRSSRLSRCEKIFLLGFQSLSHLDLLTLSELSKEKKEENKRSLFFSFFFDSEKNQVTGQKKTERMELFESGRILRERLKQLNFQLISSFSEFSDDFRVSNLARINGSLDTEKNKEENKREGTEEDKKDIQKRSEFRLFQKIASQLFSENPNPIAVFSEFKTNFIASRSSEETTKILESENELKSEIKEKPKKEFQQQIGLLKKESPKEEILGVAKRVQQLLSEEKALKHSDIALVCPKEYKDDLKRIFHSLQIPIESSFSELLIHQNLVRTILAILEIRISGLTWNSCLNFLRSNYIYMKADSIGKAFEEDMHKIFSSKNTRIIVQEILRYNQQLFKKRERKEENPIETLKARYKKKFHDSESENQLEIEESKKQEKQEKRAKEKKRLELCIQYLEELQNRIQKFPSPEARTISAYEFAQLLEKAIIEDFAILYNVYRYSDPDIVRRDSIVLASFLENLEELTYCFHSFSSDSLLSLREFDSSLRDILSHSYYQDRGAGLDSVHCLSAGELLGLSYQKIFVLRFSEGEFPRNFIPGIFRNPERNRLKDFLKTPQKHRELENFSFYTLFLASRQEIYFSYPLRNEEFRETTRSFFLEELFLVLNVLKPSTEAMIEESVIKESMVEEIMTEETTIENSSVIEPLRSQEENSRDVLASDARFYFQFSSKEELYSDYARLLWEEYLNEDLNPEYKNYKKYFQDYKILDSNTLSLMETKIEMEKKRSLEAFSEYEGILKGALLRSRLKEKFQNFNVTQLERYAQCPSRFFFHDVLRLRTEVSESMWKGTAVHEILRQFYLELYKIEDSETITKTESSFLKLDEKGIRRKVEEIARNYFEKNAKEWLWKNQIKDLVDDLSHFIQKDLETNQNYRPFFLEKSFVWDVDSDFQVHGRIDRIDLSLETKEFRVIDYKSSKSTPSKKDFQRKIQEGYSFQPLVYTEVAKEISKSISSSILSIKEKKEKIGKIQGTWNEYYVLHRLKKKVSSRSLNLSEKVEGEVLSFVEWSQYYLKFFVDQILKGEFPASPMGDCSCEFSGVCRVYPLGLIEKKSLREDRQTILEKLRDKKSSQKEI